MGSESGSPEVLSSPSILVRYPDEQGLRYNNRKDETGGPSCKLSIPAQGWYGTIPSALTRLLRSV